MAHGLGILSFTSPLGGEVKGLSFVSFPLTPALSPQGRGSSPNFPRRSNST
jgi:hypothetical protein